MGFDWLCLRRTWSFKLNFKFVFCFIKLGKYLFRRYFSKAFTFDYFEGLYSYTSALESIFNPDLLILRLIRVVIMLRNNGDATSLQIVVLPHNTRGYWFSLILSFKTASFRFLCVSSWIWSSVLHRIFQVKRFFIRTDCFIKQWLKSVLAKVFGFSFDQIKCWCKIIGFWRKDWLILLIWRFSFMFLRLSSYSLLN